MSDSVASKGLKVAVRVAFAGLALALLSGCSSDVTRFASPFSSSSSAPDEMPTGQIPETQAIPRSTVTSAPLPAPVAQPGAFNNVGVPANQPPMVAQAQPVVSSVAAPSGASEGGWSVAGGTPIVVAAGENSKIIARRYGVPENVLLSLNGFSGAAQVRQGAHLVIPVYNAGSAHSAALPKTQAHVAEAGKPGEKYKLVAGPRSAAEEAARKKEAMSAKAGQMKVASAPVDMKKDKKHETAQAAELAHPQAGKADQKVAALKTHPVVEQAKPAAVASLEPAKNQAQPAKPAVDPTPTASLSSGQEAAAPESAAASDGAPEFRWPARGRVIEGFKAGANDGINIAVPEGTSVKAAEAGVVAYAGSELKGYGNLILVRHPNGFVSAYANNSELMVKRGDQVKRGQVIAKSGQTGSVSTPQLHFELRKGSTPVDPVKYLAGL